MDWCQQGQGSKTHNVVHNMIGYSPIKIIRNVLLYYPKNTAWALSPTGEEGSFSEACWREGSGGSTCLISGVGRRVSSRMGQLHSGVGVVVEAILLQEIPNEVLMPSEPNYISEGIRLIYDSCIAKGMSECRR